MTGNASTSPPDDLDPSERRAKRRAAARLTALLGVAFAVLLLLGAWMLTSEPGPRSSDEALRAFYEGGDVRRVLLGGLYVVPFSAVAFLWFVAALRQWTERAGRPLDQLLGTVQLLSGVAFLTLEFAATGAATVVAAAVTLTDLPLDLDAARNFPLYGRALFIVFGMRVASIFVLSTARLGHGAGLLPRWFVGISVAVAVLLLLVASLDARLIAVFPFWVLLLSGVVWFGVDDPGDDPPRR